MNHCNTKQCASGSGCSCGDTLPPPAQVAIHHPVRPMRRCDEMGVCSGTGDCASCEQPLARASLGAAADDSHPLPVYFADKEPVSLRESLAFWLAVVLASGISVAVTAGSAGYLWQHLRDFA